MGIVAFGVKAAMYQHIKTSPPIEQPHQWGFYGVFGVAEAHRAALAAAADPAGYDWSGGWPEVYGDAT